MSHEFRDAAADEFVTEFVEEALHSAQRDTHKTLRRDARRLLRADDKRRRSFEKRLKRRWRSALNLYDLCLLLASQIGENFNRERTSEAQQANDLVFFVLVRLHARACLVASEVRALLVSGHAAGAHARWRTLHEVAVIAFFVQEGGQEVARRYLDHEMIQSAKAVREYQVHCASLGEESFEQTYLDDLEQRRQALLAQYGRDFDNEWGWAAAALNKRNPNFTDIERATRLGHMRPYYRMASYSVHSQVKSLRLNLGNMRPDELLLAGPSNVGLTNPAHGALISLMQCTATLAAIKPTIESSILLPILLNLTEKAGNAFLAVEQQIAREENERKPAS